MRNAVLITIIMASTTLTGCVFATGIPSEDNGYRSRTSPTAGAQLLDLDRAHTAGVITDIEFERAKSQILNDID